MNIGTPKFKKKTLKMSKYWKCQNVILSSPKPLLSLGNGAISKVLKMSKILKRSEYRPFCTKAFVFLRFPNGFPHALLRRTQFREAHAGSPMGLTGFAVKRVLLGHLFPQRFPDGFGETLDGNRAVREALPPHPIPVGYMSRTRAAVVTKYWLCKC